MNWYKHSQTVQDPSRPSISTSPIIQDKNVYWQFQFMNMPLKINVNQIIHRATDYLKAINSAIFQNTAAVQAMQSGGGLANVSSDNPWTINVDFNKVENAVKANVQNELRRLEQQQMQQLGPEKIQEFKEHPELVNKAFVDELTNHIQEEVIKEYAEVLSHEATHNLQMNATRTDIEQAKQNVLNNANAILQKTPQKNQTLIGRVQRLHSTPLKKENIMEFNNVIKEVFQYVIDTSDAKSLNDAVANLNKIQYMPKSQAEAEAEKAEKVVL